MHNIFAVNALIITVIKTYTRQSEDEEIIT